MKWACKIALWKVASASAGTLDGKQRGGRRFIRELCSGFITPDLEFYGYHYLRWNYYSHISASQLFGPGTLGHRVCVSLCVCVCHCVLCVCEWVGGHGGVGCAWGGVGGVCARIFIFPSVCVFERGQADVLSARHQRAWEILQAIEFFAVSVAMPAPRPTLVRHSSTISDRSLFWVSIRNSSC